LLKRICDLGKNVIRSENHTNRIYVLVRYAN